MEKTKILLYTHFSRKEKFVYTSETYDCGVLFITLSGSFQYRKDNGPTLIAKSGDAIYSPPGCAFQRKVISPVDLYMIKFDGTLPRGEYIINSRIRDNLAALPPINFLQTFHEAPLVEHYCRDIIYTLLKEEKVHTIPVLNYIEENIGKPIKNRDLSDILHCSEVSLIAHFKSLTGKTPRQYITEKRLEKAKEMLLSTDVSIAQTATLCGFDDPLYFSKVFRKHSGFSPSEFKSKFKL